MSERRLRNPLNIRFCSGCRKFLSGRRFSQHRKSCAGTRPVAVNPAVMLRDPQEDAEFVRNVLEKFRDTEAGRLCVSDNVIRRMGYRRYCLRPCHESKDDDAKKSPKHDEVRKGVMQDMRELARLLIQFKSTAAEHGIDCDNLCAGDMFQKHHVTVLNEAIDTMGDGGKNGLKKNLHCLVTRTVKLLKGMYAEVTEDDKCYELDLFVDAYKYQSRDTCEPNQSHAQSRETPQRSTTQTEEQALATLKEYATKIIDSLTSGGAIHGDNYALLRSMVLCQLTLFNGSRGEEPARMTIDEWRDAKNGEWLRKNEVCIENTFMSTG